MTSIFFSLAAFWLNFVTLKGPKRVLAFLVPSLGQKNLELIKEIPKNIEKSSFTKNATNLSLLDIINAAPPLAKSPLISSCSSKKCLTKLA